MAYFDLIASLVTKKKKQEGQDSASAETAPSTEPPRIGTKTGLESELRADGTRKVLGRSVRDKAVSDFYKTERAEFENLKASAKRLSISEFSSLINSTIKTDPSRWGIPDPPTYGMPEVDRTVMPGEEFYRKTYAIGERYGDERVKASSHAALEALMMRKKLMESALELEPSSERAERLTKAEGLLNESKTRLATLGADPTQIAQGEIDTLKYRIPLLEDSVKQISKDLKTVKIGDVAEDLLDRDEMRDFLRARIRDGRARDSSVKPLLDPAGEPKNTAVPGLAVFRELQMMGPAFGVAASGTPAAIPAIVGLAALYDRVNAKRANRIKEGVEPGTPAPQNEDEDEKLYNNIQKIFSHPDMKFVHSAWFFALTVLAAGLEAAVNIHLASLGGRGHSNGVLNMVRQLVSEERQQKQAAYQSYLKEREFRLRALESRQRQGHREFMDQISLARLDLMRQRISQHEGLRGGKESLGDPIADKLFSEYSRKESKAASIAKQLSDPLMSEGMTEQESSALRSQMIRLRVESDAIFEDYQTRLNAIAGQPAK